jgi:hypothetical protein
VTVVGRETARLIFAPELPFQKVVRDVVTVGAVILKPVVEPIGAEMVIGIVFSLSDMFEPEDFDSPPRQLYIKKKCNHVCEACFLNYC